MSPALDRPRRNLLSILARELKARTPLFHNSRKNLARGFASGIVEPRCAKGGAGTGNPAHEANSENTVFRGAVAHVQTFGLKAAAHDVCMLPAPAAPARKRAGARGQSA